MFGAKDSFDKRLVRVEKTRLRKGDGYVPVVGPDGLVVVRKRRGGFNIPLRGMLYLLAGFILFKSIALAQFGNSGYEERLDILRQGTAVEQAGAFILQPDRASIWVSDLIRPIIR